MKCSCATPSLHRQKTPGRICHGTFCEVFFLLREKAELMTIFLINSSVQHEDTKMFFSRRQVSQGRRQRGVTAQETFKFVLDNHCTVTAVVFPPLRAMSRSSSVEGCTDILARRGVEGIIFFLRQEGCQGLQEDRRGNQSSHGKFDEASQKHEETFYIYNILKEPYIYSVSYTHLTLPTIYSV